MIQIEGSQFELTQSDLESTANLIAIVHILKAEAPHWNSAKNEEWTSDDPFERTPLIYSDFHVEVEQVVSGSITETEIVIRTVGGTVKEVTFEADAEAALEKGERYLVFLEWTATPTENGSQDAWTVVGGRQGVFARTESGEWMSSSGKIMELEGG